MVEGFFLTRIMVLVFVCTSFQVIKHDTETNQREKKTNNDRNDWGIALFGRLFRGT